MRLLINKVFFFKLLTVLLTGCAEKQRLNVDRIAILPVEQVKWEKLNPARGDRSPQAGTLWGDRKGKVATAFLAKFVDGFSSPPHIHNVSYRAIVIDGEIHNDDPKASTMWMPKGSYWTQPAGEAHITSARGKSNIAFVEIDRGPYLVKPIKQRFDNGERPYNIHVSNIIWTEKGDLSISPLWKNAEGIVTGQMLRFNGKAKINAESARIVVISSKVGTERSEINPLLPGSFVEVENSGVQLTCSSDQGCMLYVKSDLELEL